MLVCFCIKDFFSRERLKSSSEQIEFRFDTPMCLYLADAEAEAGMQQRLRETQTRFQTQLSNQCSIKLSRLISRTSTKRDKDEKMVLTNRVSGLSVWCSHQEETKTRISSKQLTKNTMKWKEEFYGKLFFIRDTTKKKVRNKNLRERVFFTIFVVCYAR